MHSQKVKQNTKYTMFKGQQGSWYAICPMYFESKGIFNIITKKFCLFLDQEHKDKPIKENFNKSMRNIKDSD